MTFVHQVGIDKKITHNIKREIDAKNLKNIKSIIIEHLKLDKKTKIPSI